MISAEEIDTQVDAEEQNALAELLTITRVAMPRHFGGH